MKMKYEYEVRETKEKVLDIPKKFQFIYDKEEDEWTDKEWELAEDKFPNWLHTALDSQNDIEEICVLERID